MKTRWLFLLVVCTIWHVSASAQNTQTISGLVTEQYGLTPIPFAKVEVLKTDFVAVTDSLGYFKLSDVPTGRIDLKISAETYKTQYLQNLELLTGKQLVLNIELADDITYLSDVKIVAKDEGHNSNDMVKVSFRRFSIEESKRYAGSLNDVQRMASGFAGITTANDQVNDIIVRGNMPSGMLFRLDGMNIPNPNHWSMPGSSGGTVSMLNNNVLRNSSFLTGAFPAAYDAFSGVFDLKTRNGNYNKHEFLFQFGFNGIEAGAEGPIHKKSKTTYLVNYRKSFLEILSLLVNFGTGTAIPKYQDAFFKLNMPTKKAGIFSLVATGGTSAIHFKPEEEKQTDFTYQDLTSESRTGVIGLTHRISPMPKLSFNTSFMLSGVLSLTRIDNVWLHSNSTIISEPFVRNKFNDNKLELHHFTTYKLNNRNLIKVGFYVDYLHGNYGQDVFLTTTKNWVRNIDYAGNYLQTNIYLSHLHKFNENIELVSGVAYKYLSLTNKQVLEPKLSASFKTGKRGVLSAGTGFYSKAPSLIHVTIADIQYGANNAISSVTQHNLGLDYMKSFHSVVGYDFFITPKLHIQLEAYYQHLFSIITAKNVSNSEADNMYAALNEFSFSFDLIPERLGNNGIGRNYGVEITIEQFLNKGFYFLITSSVFNSNYKAVDAVWRNTRFNSNFVTNFLVGKEFIINPKFKLLVDLKANYMRGNRFIPLDEQSSIANNFAVYNYAEAYSKHLPDFFRMDFRIGFKIIGKKITQEVAFEAQNITNRKNVFSQQYNSNTKKVETLYQNGILPMGLFRIYF